MTSNSCAGKGVSGGVVVISQLQNLCPRLPDEWGICPAATTGQDGCNTFSQLENLGNFPSTAGSPAAFVVACTSGALAGMVATLWGLAFLAGLADISSRGITPSKPPHLRRRGSNLISSHSSFTLSANRHGFPPVGGSVFSTQYWRAQVYATIFSLCIPLMSQQVKIESGGGRKFLLRRHGGAGGA